VAKKFKVGSTIKFVGYKSDVEMAKLVFDCLFISAKVVARKTYPGKYGRALRRSFRVGLGIRLIQRAKEEKQTDQKESSRYALVVVEKKDHVNKWMDDNLNLRKRRTRQMAVDGEAYNKGKSHANQMDLMNRSKMEQSNNNPTAKPIQIGLAK